MNDIADGSDTLPENPSLFRRTGWITIAFLLVALGSFSLERALNDSAWLQTFWNWALSFSKALVAATIIAVALSILWVVRKVRDEVRQTATLREAMARDHAGIVRKYDAEVSLLGQQVNDAINKFMHSKGANLISDTIVDDVIRSLSGEGKGTEDRYRLAFQHLRSLSSHPPSLAPAVTFLFSRSTDAMMEDIRKLSNLGIEFALRGYDQISLSRQFLEATQKEVHFIDFEATLDIENAWSIPFKNFLGEIANRGHLERRCQTILCADPRSLKNPRSSSKLKRQIEFMKMHKFSVFLVDKACSRKLGADTLNWRFEIYDDTSAVRIERLPEYKEDQDLDVTVLDAKKNGHLQSLLRELHEHHVEV